MEKHLRKRGWRFKRPPEQIRTREAHPGWKGDAASKAAKNMRARKWIPISGMCERCHVKPACDRHHKDSDPGNNERSNIAFLCRRCHMEVDGRLERLKEAAKVNHQTTVKPPKPCVNCGELAKPLSHGRCINCAAYFRRRGVERPYRAVVKIEVDTTQMYADYVAGLSLNQVASKYGVSLSCVYHRFRKAELPCRKAGNSRGAQEAHNREKDVEIMDFREDTK